MKWFRKLSAKPKPDPLAALRREPTLEERIALREEWQRLDILDALRDGDHVMCGYTNVAPGTRGYSLYMLHHAGLMSREQLPSLPGDGGRWRYTLTAAGRAKVAKPNI